MNRPPQSPSQLPKTTEANSSSALDMAALTHQMVKGDDMAYRLFHDAYFPRLSRYLLVVSSGNEELMREGLQECFRRVVKHIRVFTTEEAFWSWLTVLARTSLYDESRKRRRYLSFLDRFRSHSSVVEPRIAAPSGDEHLSESLTKSLSLLPVDERKLIELKYVDRLPVSEIARCLQTTEGAIESRLVRIRRKLKAAVLAELKHGS